MADELDTRAPHSVPLWEHENVAKNATTSDRLVTPSRASVWTSKLDRVLPPHKSYLGLRRKWFLVTLAAFVAALLALIIGLSVGLSQHRKSS